MCRSSPTQCPEPWQMIRVVNAVTNGDDFEEAFDLNTQDLCKQTNNYKGGTGQAKLMKHSKRFDLKQKFGCSH